MLMRSPLFAALCLILLWMAFLFGTALYQKETFKAVLYLCIGVYLYIKLNGEQ